MFRRNYGFFRKGTPSKKGDKSEQRGKKGSIDEVGKNVDKESKKLFDSKASQGSQSIDEKYNETVRRMLNSGEVSPIMRKVLEKEMKKIEERAQLGKKSQETASGEKKSGFWRENESKGSKAAEGNSEESQQFSDFTEQALRQGESSINALEKELRDGTIPSFLRPVAQQLLDKLKSFQASVRSGVQQEEKEKRSNESTGEESGEDRVRQGTEKASEQLIEQSNEQPNKPSNEQPNKPSNEPSNEPSNKPSNEPSNKQSTESTGTNASNDASGKQSRKDSQEQPDDSNEEAFRNSSSNDGGGMNNIYLIVSLFSYPSPCSFSKCSSSISFLALNRSMETLSASHTPRL